MNALCPQGQSVCTCALFWDGRWPSYLLSQALDCPPPSCPAHRPPTCTSPICLHRAPVTALNLEGYGLAFLAVLYYNYSKLKSMQQTAAAPPKAEAAEAQGEEGERLLSVSSGGAPGGSTAPGGSGSGQVQLATPRRLQAGS